MGSDGMRDKLPSSPRFRHCPDESSFVVVFFSQLDYSFMRTQVKNWSQRSVIESRPSCFQLKTTSHCLTGISSPPTSVPSVLPGAEAAAPPPPPWRWPLQSRGRRKQAPISSLRTFGCKAIRRNNGNQAEPKRGSQQHSLKSRRNGISAGFHQPKYAHLQERLAKRPHGWAQPLKTVAHSQSNWKMHHLMTVILRDWLASQAPILQMLKGRRLVNGNGNSSGHNVFDNKNAAIM